MSSSMDICGFQSLHNQYHRHMSNNYSCARRYERMYCECGEPGMSYSRLRNAPTLLELSSVYVHREDIKNLKQARITFHNDDGTCADVVVEKNLRSSDLCQILATKNRVPKDVHWSLVEYWPVSGIERTLEDHEEVLAVYIDMQLYGKPSDKRFVYRKDFRKYAFFNDPEQFFPSDMVDTAWRDEMIRNAPFLASSVALEQMIATTHECPPVCSHVWIKTNTKVWQKVFLVLRNKKLYICPEVEVVSKFIKSIKGSNPKDSDNDNEDLELFAMLSDYNVYTALNARNQYKAPTEFGICLRPTATAEGSCEEAAGGGPEIHILACESEKSRVCWLVAMRLAKYGKQLRDNYRALKNKQVEAISPREFGSYSSGPSESVRRVAMDFTGSTGRIVDDPKEVKAIAAAEGYAWKRRFRLSTRHTVAGGSRLLVEGIESGAHTTHPWFHRGISRDYATELVKRKENVDGVFLVRDSKSSAGSFVLTMRSGNKVYHTQIIPVMDKGRDTVCFTLDHGVTRFYDLVQLVDFYKLNAGCLPTRLTHYVLQHPTGPPFSKKPTASTSF